MGKPQDIASYRKWLLDAHKVDINNKVENHYSSVTEKMHSDFIRSACWVDLMDSINEYDQEYLILTGYDLFPPTAAGDPKKLRFEPTLSTKEFQPFLLKTFRKNILENDRWPEPPNDGWVLPATWYSQIHDVLRTLFLVKYLDGVEFVTEKLATLFRGHGLDCTVSKEAREEGYYAIHILAKQEFEIPKMDWDTERVSACIEFQLTTQLQEVIRRLLHQFYERHCVQLERVPSSEWRWDYRSNEFTAGYLGHILHYMEGMIMEVRDQQRKELLSKEQFISYLNDIGVTPVLQQRVENAIEFYESACSLEIEDLFVSEYISEDGTRNYENLWLVSDGFIMEAISFATSDDFDMVSLRTQVPYWWRLRKQHYDFRAADSASRMNLEVGLPWEGSMKFKASGNNCDRLAKVFRDYILPFFGCKTPARD